jgi:hypothetical protein
MVLPSQLEAPNQWSPANQSTFSATADLSTNELDCLPESHVVSPLLQTLLTQFTLFSLCLCSSLTLLGPGGPSLPSITSPDFQHHHLLLLSLRVPVQSLFSLDLKSLSNSTLTASLSSHPSTFLPPAFSTLISCILPSVLDGQPGLTRTQTRRPPSVNAYRAGQRLFSISLYHIIIVRTQSAHTSEKLDIHDHCRAISKDPPSFFSGNFVQHWNTVLYTNISVVNFASNRYVAPSIDTCIFGFESESRC